MNWRTVEGHWDQIKGEIRGKWAKLTDDDVASVLARRDLLIGKIEERYGVMKDEAARQVDEWIDRLDLSTTRKA